MAISNISSGIENYNSTNVNKANNENGGNGMTLVAVGGKPTMLCSDALFSIGSARNGESANVYRADDYSDNNPIYIIKGMGADGKEYKQEVDVRTVNPNNCSYIELLALNVHTGINSNQSFMQMSRIREDVESSSYFKKMNYLSKAYNNMEEQHGLRNWESYLNWGKWIQNINKYDY